MHQHTQTITCFHSFFSHKQSYIFPFSSKCFYFTSLHDFVCVCEAHHYFFVFTVFSCRGGPIELHDKPSQKDVVDLIIFVISLNSAYVYRDPILATQYMTNIKEDTKLTSAILAMSTNSALQSLRSLYRRSYLWMPMIL